MKSLANEFFSTMAEGAEKHHDAHRDQYELIVNGIKDERDIARQVALVEEMTARRVDAIVIAPADSKVLVDVLKPAQAAGIVVVNIDNKLDDEVLAQAGVKIPFVGPDNLAGARMVGEYLAKHLQAGRPCRHSRRRADCLQRPAAPTLGFEDAMNAAGMKIVDSQSGQWEMDMANKVSSAMLTHTRI